MFKKIFLLSVLFFLTLFGCAGHGIMHNPSPEEVYQSQRGPLLWEAKEIAEQPDSIVSAKESEMEWDEVELTSMQKTLVVQVQLYTTLACVKETQDDTAEVQEAVKKQFWCLALLRFTLAEDDEIKREVFYFLVRDWTEALPEGYAISKENMWYL